MKNWKYETLGIKCKRNYYVEGSEEEDEQKILRVDMDDKLSGLAGI